MRLTKQLKLRATDKQIQVAVRVEAGTSGLQVRHPNQSATLPDSSVNSRLASDTPLLRTLAITNKIQIPGESYRGLTETDSRYYGLSLLRNYGHFRGTNITILLLFLTLDKVDTMNFTCDINCSLMFVICQSRLQKTSGMFIFA